MWIDERQEVIDDLLYGNETIYMVYVDYCDKTFAMYAFSSEELQMSFVENLAHNCRELGVENIKFNENVLDLTPDEQWLMAIH